MGFAVEVGADISIHALLTESDFSTRQFSHRLSYFNPRSPHGERRWLLSIRKYCYCKFQSTLSSRRATSALLIICLAREISIHALLTESDYFSVRICTNCRISIHALLTESDFRFFGIFKVRQSFQSTLSSRRATSCINCM